MSPQNATLLPGDGGEEEGEGGGGAACCDTVLLGERKQAPLMCSYALATFICRGLMIVINVAACTEN